MAPVGAKFQDNPIRQFFSHGDNLRQHKGIVESVQNQGRYPDGFKIGPATGAGVIVGGIRITMQRSGDLVVEAVEIPQLSHVLEGDRQLRLQMAFAPIARPQVIQQIGLIEPGKSVAQPACRQLQQKRYRDCHGGL